jgi:hypothetical protein
MIQRSNVITECVKRLERTRTRVRVRPATPSFPLGSAGYSLVGAGIASHRPEHSTIFRQVRPESLRVRPEEALELRGDPRL